MSERIEKLSYASRLNAFGTERLDELKATLSNLSNGRGVVLIMRYIDGLEIKEIATALGISASTAKRRLYYGRAELRKKLKDRRC